LTTERYAVPGLLLMEAAASRTVEAIEHKYGPGAGKRVLIICGRGNNGGDGAAVGRQLRARGAAVDILLLGRMDETRGDARTNFAIARALPGSEAGCFGIKQIDTAERLWLEAEEAPPYDIIVDAIFGTGLARPAAGLFADAIRLINERSSGSAVVVAVDIPSGLASDSAELIGPAVRAALTVTLTAPKLGNVLPPACEYNGELVIAPIGSPDDLINSSGSHLNLVEKAMVRRWLDESRRAPHANKGDAGKVLIIAGSRGKTGAACLVGEGAMRAGAGLVTVATPETCQSVVAARLITECMTEPLRETSSGSVSSEALERAVELAGGRDVVAMGPGLGSSDESTRAFVRSFVGGRQRPLVLDADALNALAPWPGELGGSPGLPLVITPHPGEMARLADLPLAEVIKDRVETARNFAVAHAMIVVLKGSRTVIAASNGEIYINPTGNPGMASGGTGDTLTGIIGGLLAQKRDDPLMAAIAGVYLHGLAGDIAAARLGTRAMMASDISSHLGAAFLEAGGPAEGMAKRFD